MNKISTIPSRTLVFNSRKKLIAILQSNTAASNVFNAKVQAIHCACVGRCISCKGYYFRNLDSSVEISLEDLGSLRLEEYDELCGINRKVYKNTMMTRKGMKYNKKNKERDEQKNQSKDTERISQ